ncbi:MAG: DUF4301 family protein [Pseudarcicella sp.]|nr:DUF4301 family protein [Pseudarcicella sp.]MBP6409942.1 DUF4301 family protein [Pseudarcicella sp.]
MFFEKDFLQIHELGIDLELVSKQIKNFENGFPFMQLEKAATLESGVIKLTEDQLHDYIASYETKIVKMVPLKFVPASGAATRMFKSLYALMEEGKADASTKAFFEGLDNFAFSEELKEKLNGDLNEKSICENLLTSVGLDYGFLPKGLIKFHKYENEIRTAIEEHLVEGANYAHNNGVVKLHFTVSPEHLGRFLKLFNAIIPIYEVRYNLEFDISFSEQRRSTDTIAVDENNQPFRDKEGALVFRPAGHGALLSNLNDIEADIVFVKNIDNVVPDRIKSETYEYKKALAGLLLKYQDKIFRYQYKLKEWASEPLLREISEFCEAKLCIIHPPELANYNHTEKVIYFQKKLNRPLRVCGVVKNTGEPGGGPFWCKNQDGSVSLQIVEAAQVNMDSIIQKNLFSNSTHFNPVDLICGMKNYKGEKFNLLNFRDDNTGFITLKSKDGAPLKAQELPGLWNGSMANWNTIFVEVPLITFNPVKTVNDLLRVEHQ